VSAQRLTQRLRQGTTGRALLALVLAAVAAGVAVSAGAGPWDESQHRRSRRPAATPRTGGKSMRLKAGKWGGARASLVARAGYVLIEFDCAHGRIEGPLALDAAGRFDVGGTYVRERGGPARVGADEPDSAAPHGESEETLRARYTGVVEGRSMTLTVRLVESGAEVGTFSLRLGEPPTLTKCH
jgi:hypothetical protein